MAELIAGDGRRIGRLLPGQGQGAIGGGGNDNLVAGQPIAVLIARPQLNFIFQAGNEILLSVAQDRAAVNGNDLGAVAGYGGQNRAGAAQSGRKIPPGQPFLYGKPPKPILIAGDGRIRRGAPGQDKLAGLPGAHDHFLAGRAETFANARPQLGQVVVAKTYPLKKMADNRPGPGVGQAIQAAGQVGKIGPVDLPPGGHILPRRPLAQIPLLQAVLIAADPAGGDRFPPGQGQAALRRGPQHHAGGGIAILIVAPRPQLRHIIHSGQQVLDPVPQHPPALLRRILAGSQQFDGRQDIAIAAGTEIPPGLPASIAARLYPQLIAAEIQDFRGVPGQQKSAIGLSDSGYLIALPELPVDIAGAHLGRIFLPGHYALHPMAADRTGVAAIQSVQAHHQTVKIGTAADQAIVAILPGGGRHFADKVADGESWIEKSQQPDCQGRDGVSQPPFQIGQTQGRRGNDSKGYQGAQHRGPGAVDHQRRGQNRQHQEHCQVVSRGPAARRKGGVVEEGGKGHWHGGGQLIAERGGVGGQAGGAAVGQNRFQVNIPHRGKLQPEGQKRIANPNHGQAEQGGYKGGGNQCQHNKARSRCPLHRQIHCQQDADAQDHLGQPHPFQVVAEPVDQESPQGQQGRHRQGGQQRAQIPEQGNAGRQGIPGRQPQQDIGQGQQHGRAGQHYIRPAPRDGRAGKPELGENGRQQQGKNQPGQPLNPRVGKPAH